MMMLQGAAAVLGGMVSREYGGPRPNLTARRADSALCGAIEKPPLGLAPGRRTKGRPIGRIPPPTSPRSGEGIGRGVLETSPEGERHAAPIVGGDPVARPGGPH